jgi:hypothetical protein
MRMLDQLAGAIQLITQLLAKRVGRGAGDVAVQAAAGAMLGALMAVLLTGIDNPTADYLALMDEALAQMEAGFPLS